MPLRGVPEGEVSEYERMMANRKPNPEMRDCPFCDARVAVGQKCCSWRYLKEGTNAPRPHGRRYARGTNQGQRAKPEKRFTGWPKLVDQWRTARKEKP